LPLFIEEKLAGIIAVADTLRQNAKQVIDEVKRGGKRSDIDEWWQWEDCKGLSFA
jgi:cation transport ATPase